MNDATFVTLYVVVAAPVAVCSWRAFRCNLARFRAARAAAPLDGLDLSGATVAPTWAPRTWPAADAVSDPSVAAAYAALADDRAVSFALAGEIVMLIGGGAIGATIPQFRNPILGIYLLVAALVPTMIGVGARMRSTRQWEPLAARYRERYAALTAVPLPTPPRRGLLGSLFRR